MSLLCLAIRPLLARLDVDGPPSPRSSRARPAGKFMSRSRLKQLLWRYRPCAGVRRHGRDHPARQRVQRFRARPLRVARKAIVSAIAMTVVRNPLIWACAIGLAINVLHLPLPTIWHEVADALGRSSLAIGLLVTGAGLHLEGLFRPSQGAAVGVFLKLVLMPVLAIGLALGFGLSRGRVIEPLCNGPANGGRCSASGADHRAPDHFGRHHHANRDRACGVTAFSCAPRGRCSRPPRRRSTQRGQVSVTINAICAMTAVFHAPCMITVSQVEPAR
jgi:hypothetical protein